MLECNTSLAPQQPNHLLSHLCRTSTEDRTGKLLSRVALVALVALVDLFPISYITLSQKRMAGFCFQLAMRPSVRLG
ncbi:hypothetical protein BP00DRAFT_424372 [Aspergillus indologenus CBS 114.80]|uniref:Uncharacterized protein n=1 Tax=Aspergillus indologenus CBS 114.80 TaxID=1450541 RepID=A0A2V5I8L8_9EURO|nr:hypothetical protein BP00DRAFT_424372 [Aspergillus indologenus CBS 114.80]